MSELLRNMVVVDEDSLLPSASPQVSRTSKILHAVGQRIPGVILIAIWTLVFIGPPLMPTLYWSVVMLVHVFLVTNAVRMAVGLVITAIKTKKYINTDWNRKYVEFAQKQKLEELPVRSDMIKHVIVVPNYKEDMATLCDTLDTLAHHEHACLNYKVGFLIFMIVSYVIPGHIGDGRGRGRMYGESNSTCSFVWTSLLSNSRHSSSIRDSR